MFGYLNALPASKLLCSCRVHGEEGVWQCMKMLPLLALCLLSACSSPHGQVVSDVTRCHKLASHGSGQTFRVVNRSPRGSEQESQSRSSLIAAHLVHYGWRPLGVGEHPDYRVTFAYFQKADQRGLGARIHDTNNKVVFDGLVNSAGKKQIEAVLPQMIDSLFDGFPGTNGRTVTVVKRFD